jgi:alkylation response protein AidB-like acyl-CoA dehydrogenase
MDLLLTEDQERIVESTAAFAADRLPLKRLHGRDGPPDRVPPQLWQEIAQMGWLGMSVGEESGGVGYTAVEEALVFRELGRVCAPPRILFTALAAKAAAAAGYHRLASRLTSGELTAAYAAQDDFAAAGASLHRRRLYEPAGSDCAMSVDGDWIRVLDISGQKFELRPALDKSVSMSIADLSDAPVLAQLQSAPLRHAAALLQAAGFVGIAEATRDMIVEYAKIRETFGKPIGSYQAVRHPCAEMAMRCEEARAQLFFASLVLADAEHGGSRDTELHVACARVLSESAALRNVDDNIQLHGGIGVTDEFTAHFYLKRAHTMASWFSGRREHLEHILNAPLTPF